MGCTIAATAAITQCYESLIFRAILILVIALIAELNYPDFKVFLLSTKLRNPL